jgi:chemotaxis protein MotB
MKTMKRRTFSLLAAATIALAVAACAGMRMNQLADQLRTAVAGEPVVVTVQNGVITMTSSADYLYPSGGWQLAPGAPILSKIAPVLAPLQNTSIVVAGYTDNTPIGPQLRAQGITSNQELSYKRAVAVVDFLAAHGVKQNLLSAQGYGDANPVAPNDTPEGKAKNRRVEMTLRGDGT